MWLSTKRNSLAFSLCLWITVSAVAESLSSTFPVSCVCVLVFLMCVCMCCYHICLRPLRGHWFCVRAPGRVSHWCGCKAGTRDDVAGSWRLVHESDSPRARWNSPHPLQTPAGNRPHTSTLYFPLYSDIFLKWTHCENYSELITTKKALWY